MDNMSIVGEQIMPEKKIQLLEKQLVSIRTLAERWDVAANTVTRVLDEAGVRPIHLSEKKGGTVRFVAEEVERFLVRRRSPLAPGLQPEDRETHRGEEKGAA